MAEKPTYEELERKIADLDREIIRLKSITERNGNRHDLQADLSAVIENTEDIIVIRDLEGRVLIWNEAFRKLTRKLFGFEIKTGIRTADYLPPDKRKYWEDVLARVLKGERIREEFSYTFENGEIRHYDISFNPIIMNGKITGCSEFTRDITERKQVEEKLRENEHYFKAAVATSPIGIGLVVDRKLDWANGTMYRMVGYEEGSLFGESARILYPDDETFERTGQELYTGLAESGVSQVETQWVRKDGTVFDCVIRAGCLEPSDPAKGQVVTVTDVSPLKQAYKQLMESEAKFKTIFEAAPDGYYIIDTDGCFLDGNKTAEEIIGYGKDDLKGKSFLDLDILSQEDLAKGVEALKENRRGRPAGPLELLLHRKDGRQVTVEIKTLPIKMGAQDVILGIARDISGRKSLERQLQDAQKMEALGTLAGGIAHDFNNILTSIIGYTELALDKSGIDTGMRENLQEVYAAGNRAKDLVKQILTISRQEEKEAKPIQVAPLIKEAMKMLRSTIPTSIEFRQDIHSEPLIVQANPTQLHQIVVNLATNAMHAMKEREGVLEVVVEPVSFDESAARAYPDMKAGKYVQIAISDTGVGIPEKHLEKIFEPYFSTREKGEGSGLGLSVVHGIVKSHNGHITVYSEPGKGTTFNVYLPLAPKVSPELPEARTTELLPVGTEHILLVDDEPPIARMLQLTLERLGYTVSSRTSSIEALEAFRASPGRFDLVITDMTMPHMTGDKLSREMKAIRPDVPVILCTGFSEKINARGEDLKIEGFLMKPVDKVSVSKKVREVLDADRDEG